MPDTGRRGLHQSWHHDYNTPEQCARYLDALGLVHLPDRTFNLVEDLREKLQVYGALTEKQAALLKDLYEEFT